MCHTMLVYLITRTTECTNSEYCGNCDQPNYIMESVNALARSQGALPLIYAYKLLYAK